MSDKYMIVKGRRRGKVLGLAMRIADYIRSHHHEGTVIVVTQKELDECIKDTRKKVLEWITSTSHITCDEGEWYVYDTEAQEWHHAEVGELLELYDGRMKEGVENV